MGEVKREEAGVAQWQSRSLPSLRRGVDFLHPLPTYLQHAARAPAPVAQWERTPWVREGSCVQSASWAPEFQTFSTDRTDRFRAMAKSKFERTKPHLNVGTIGHVDHGK